MDFFYDLVYGRLDFYACGGFLELFMSCCKKNGVRLKNLKCSNGSVNGSMRRIDLENVLDAAKKSGMEIEISERFGFPDFFIRYRKRVGIPIGIFLFFVLTGMLSSFVWSVDISGTDIIPIEEFTMALQENGLKKGALCEHIQCDDIEFALSKKYPELLWINVFRAGSRVFVTVREREDISFEKEEIFSNIVASKDGEIVRADIFSGEGVLYPGTAVVKGDLLVSGIDTFRDGTVRFLDCEAVVKARTKNYINCCSAREIDVQRIEKCKDKYFLYFFGLKLPVNFVDKSDSFTQNGYFFSSGDVVYPLGIIREQHKTFAAEHISLSDKQAVLMAFYDFSVAAFELYRNADVLERKINISKTNGVTVDGEFFCVEDIALKKRFTVESDGTVIR